jgi:hypothetical protein
VPWFALISADSTTTVEIYRSREQAEEELRQAVEDEPEWSSLLSVVPLDLPEPSPN